MLRVGAAPFDELPPGDRTGLVVLKEPSRPEPTDISAFQERAQAKGVDVPLHEACAVERHPGDAHRRRKGPERIVEHLLPVRRARTEGDREGHALASPPGPTGSLQIVGGARRRIVHHDRREPTDVDAHLHGGRATEHVQLAVLEAPFERAQALSVDLRGVLGGLEVRCVGDDAVVQGGPGSERASLPHLRITLQPVCNLLAAGLAARRVAPVRRGDARRVELPASFRCSSLRKIGRQAVQCRVQHTCGIGTDRGGRQLAQHGELVEPEQISVSDRLEPGPQYIPGVPERFVDSVGAGRRIIQPGGLAKQSGKTRRPAAPPHRRPESLPAGQSFPVAGPLNVPLPNGDPHPPQIGILHLYGAGVAHEEVQHELQEYGPFPGWQRPAGRRALALQGGVAQRHEAHRLGRVHALRPAEELPIEAEVGKLVQGGENVARAAELLVHEAKAPIVLETSGSVFPRQRAEFARCTGTRELGFLLFQGRTQFRHSSKCFDLPLQLARIHDLPFIGKRVKEDAPHPVPLRLLLEPHRQTRGALPRVAEAQESPALARQPGGAGTHRRGVLQGRRHDGRQRERRADAQLPEQSVTTGPAAGTGHGPGIERSKADRNSVPIRMKSPVPGKTPCFDVLRVQSSAANQPAACG